MIIKDDFLTDIDLLNLEKTLLGNDFPWYFFPYKVGKSYENYSGNEYDFQFQHIFYNNYSAQSRYIDTLQPIINLLNPSALVRIKANLTTRTDSIIKFPMHQDFENFDGETAIFYLNTNNGFTEFESGERVQSVKNRIVIFPSNELHTGTTCTDQKIRCVLNFNYYKWKI
jgi:hypothetical protein